MTSLWLDEVEGSRQPVATLEDELMVDVCVVGGGYTGLWTAVLLKETEPSLDVVLLEAETCGSGASGRNGGFVLTWWAKFGALKRLYGVSEATRLARASEDVVVRHLPEFCAANAIDAHFRQDGWLWTATAPAQVDSWSKTVAELAAHDLNPFQALSPSDVSERSGSTEHLAGIYEPTAATIQPAMLAFGLRRVALEAGVRVFERSPMIRLQKSGKLRVETPRGVIVAERVVLALNAWSVRVAPLRRSLVVITSEMIATDPIADRLEEIGWNSGLAISDSRMMVNYYRTTLDGRIAFGKGGGTLCFGRRVRESFEPPGDRDADVIRSLRSLYPTLSDVAIPMRWSGPIDRSLTGLPFFGELESRPGAFYGAGYSGNGVGPAYLGGRILASLALGLQDEWATTPLARGPVGRFPPEPIRYVGGHVVRAAVARKEGSEDRGQRPGKLTRLLAGLAPAGLVPVEPLPNPTTRQ